MWELFLFLLFSCSCGGNLLVNPSFEGTPSDYNSTAFGWKPLVNGFFLCDRLPHSGEQAISLTPRHTYGAYQHLDIPQNHDWKKGISVNLHAYTEWAYASHSLVVVDVLYRDGSRSLGNQMRFHSGLDRWQSKCMRLELSGPLETLTIFLVGLPGVGSYGTVWFDDASVEMDASLCAEDGKEETHLHLDERLLVSVEQEDVFSPNAEKPPLPSFQLVTVATYAFSHQQLLSAIDLCAAQWQGPCVIVWYLDKPESFKPELAIDAWKAIQTKHSSAVAPTLMATFGPVPELPSNLAPVNAMRNLAESRSRTDYVLHLEPDVQVPADMHQVLLAQLKKLPDEQLPSRERVFVIPSLELARGVDAPNEKPEVVDMILSGKAAQRHGQRHRLSHSCTDLKRWMRASLPYDILPLISPEELAGENEPSAHSADKELEKRHRSQAFVPPRLFNRHYSPVLLTHKNDLFYDQRFLNGGHDKASFVAELFMRNVTFTVLSDSFVYYEHDTKPDWEVEVSVDRGLRMWFDYVNFLEEARLKYPMHDMRIFSALPVDPTVSHRGSDSPFSHRLMLAGACTAMVALLIRALLSVPQPNHGGFDVAAQSMPSSPFSWGRRRKAEVKNL